MSASFYDLTVGSYTQIVEATVGVLQKGADHCAANGITLDEVVDCRLIEDMANFHFQVVCVTHHSVEALKAMASGEFLPPNYEPMDYAALQALTNALFTTSLATDGKWGPLTAAEMPRLLGAAVDDRPVIG